MPKLKCNEEDPIIDHVCRGRRQREIQNQDMANLLFCSNATITDRMKKPEKFTIWEFRKLIQMFKWSDKEILDMLRWSRF